MTRAGTGQTELPFTFNGRSMTGRAGDTIAVALWRNGIRQVATTRKRHLPLGLFGASVTGNLARVDGMPHVRLDRTRLTAGARVTMQNCWPAPGFDLLRALSILPAPWLYGGFEHGALMPRGVKAFRRAEHLMAFLAGIADAPAPTNVPATLPAGHRIAPDLLIVGDAPEGCEAANAAVAQGQSVVLVTRAAHPGRGAIALHPDIQLFPETEVFGIYRGGTLIVAAPFDTRQGGLIFTPGQTLLATGRLELPPVVAGNHLPGVIAASAALDLAASYDVLPGQRVVVFGDGEEGRIAERLSKAGVTVIHVGPVSALTRILGRRDVTGVELAGRRIACDCVVFAGPRTPDPNLSFQAASIGTMQLRPDDPRPAVAAIGGCDAPEAAPALPANLPHDAYVCGCMDVTVGEIAHHVAEGITDLEVLKRLTSCGMGPCQGVPCWDTMAAVVAQLAPDAPQKVRRPSHRAPRRALTVAQAAGMDAMVAPDIEDAREAEGGYL